jgi:hypothetical protein
MNFEATTALMKRVRAAEAEPGSEAHKVFAKEMSKFRAAKQQSYAEFTIEMTRILAEAFKELPQAPEVLISVMRDMVPYMVGSAQWADLGFPVINLTHDFYRAIAVTDFGDVGDDPVQLPFPAMLLRLPETLRGAAEALPMFLYPVPTNSAKPGYGGFSHNTLELTADEIGFDATRMTIKPEPNERDERQAFTQWSNGIPFSSYLGDKVRSMEEMSAIERRATEIIGTEMDPSITKRARRVVGNTLLYINSNGGLPAEKRLGPNVAVEREHKTEPRFRVGRPIKLGGALRAAITGGLSGGASWKLESRFVVRGHWRNQAYGPQHSLRLKKWIAPYWKGPENVGEALERTFEVS